MKNFIICLIVGVSLGWVYNYTQKQELTTEIRKAVERGYFEGQKDALEHDVRIGWDKWGKCYRWTKSPWDDGSSFTLNISQL